MKNMENSKERQAIINRMIAIARADSPWLWGFHPKGYSLLHSWYKNSKPNLMANNTLKYKRLDPQLRAQKRAEWNKPVTWPIYLLIIVLVVVIAPAVISYRRKEHGVNGGRS